MSDCLDFELRVVWVPLINFHKFILAIKNGFYTLIWF